MSRIFLSVSFLFFGVLWAFGQAVDSSRVYELQEAVVVGRGGIAKEVIPVQVLAGEELERLSVHSVADALFFGGAGEGLRWDRRVEDGEYPEYGQSACGGVL